MKSLVAQNHALDSDSPSGAPFISVIVPVRNEQGFIERLLGELLSQNYENDRFEILVADGGSTDNTCQIVTGLSAQHSKLRLLHNLKRLSSAGRNLAIQASVGEILVIVDGHCQINNPNYLTILAEVFARSGADCVGRPQPLDVAGASLVQQAIAAARSSRLGHNPGSYIYSSVEQFVRPHSVAVAYRRSVFEVIGFFDEDFDACEDVDFNHRLEQAGMRCFFSPKVAVHYYPRRGLAGLFWQLERYGIGRVRLLRKYPQTFSVPTFMPAALVLGMLLGALPAIWSSWLSAFYLGLLASYLVIVLVVSATIARKERKLGLFPLLPMVFLAIHLGAGTGIIKQSLKGLWRRRIQHIPSLVPEQSN